MRALIYCLVALAVGVGLLMIDDIDAGLPMINLIVWPTAALAGLLVLLRSHARRHRRRPRERSHRLGRRDEPALIEQRQAPRLPRR